MVPRKLIIRPDTVLTHAFDVEARMADCPVDHTVKGMFFARFVEMATRAGVKAETLPLDKPVEHGRYVAFRDYPIRDYMRWAAAAAAKVHPRVAVSEGLRRVASDDFTHYLESGLGKVMVAFFSDARSVMLRSGQVYSLVTNGPRIDSEAVGDEIVVRYRDYHGPIECYPVGTLEGACGHFGARCEITIDVLSPSSADYRVRLL